MELKVWVEGIQRIVCGVSDATTCQDVVYALAHATGKTGRFTLVEKWRNNERLLPPQEHPLKVLSKWGEYANDVQLVLRRTSLESKSSGTLQAETVPAMKSILGDHSSSTNWQKQSFPLSPSSASKDLNKPLAYSAGGGGATNVNDSNNCKDKLAKDFKETSRTKITNVQPFKRDINEKKKTQLKQQNIEEISKESVNQKPVRNVDREPVLPISRFTVGPNTRNYNTNYASKSSAKQLQQQRIIRNCEESLSYSQPHTKSSSDVIPNSDHCTSPPPPSRIPAVSQQSSSRTTTSQEVAGNVTSSSSGGSANKLHSLIPVRRVDSSPRVGSSDENVRRMNVGSFPVPVHAGVPKLKKGYNDLKKQDLEEDSRESNVYSYGQQQDRVGYDNHYRDLIRLINLQREKISQQQAGMTQYDAEISFWEEKNKDHQRQIEMIEREMEKMESSGRDVIEEVNQLDLLHLDDELDVGRQQEKMLQSELTLLRSKLSNCETELLQCKNKIRLLMDDISEDRRWKSKEEDDRRHRERIVMNEIEDLQSELQQIVKDYDAKMKSSDKLELEVKHLESAICNKKKQVEALVHEMKAANLESLALTPAEEIRHLLEGGAHKGPGSSRKIVGSPRQLENAVPTSKNPHGVWV